jgi:hypothetical protein
MEDPHREKGERILELKTQIERERRKQLRMEDPHRENGERKLELKTQIERRK